MNEVFYSLIFFDILYWQDIWCMARTVGGLLFKQAQFMKKTIWISATFKGPGIKTDDRGIMGCYVDMI